jgi:hypothetical protein
MSVRHLDPEKCKPSEILSLPTTTRAAKLRNDYTLFGKEAMFHWLLSYTADGELRICIPMSDVIHGQVDEGVKMLLDIGGGVAQRDPMSK